MNATDHFPQHLPVLYHETLYWMEPKNGGIYVDGTTGAGGHAWGILSKSSPDGRLLGLDLDPLALQLASDRLKEFGNRVRLVHASYQTIPDQLASLGWGLADGIILDLGVSSMQLDRPEKGFSFLANGPLDMRFNPEQDLKADDLVNQAEESELANIIWKYGEERKSRQIASAIIKSRPIHDTFSLVNVITRAVGKYEPRLHPATRTFQALRIAVNREMQTIEETLPKAIASLAPGGRLLIISFHSLEDRIVKHFFQQESRDCICPPEQPVCTCNHKASLVKLTAKSITASQEEINQNPRSRSARLRAVQKKMA